MVLVRKKNVDDIFENLRQAWQEEVSQSNQLCQDPSKAFLLGIPAAEKSRPLASLDSPTGGKKPRFK